MTKSDLAAARKGSRAVVFLLVVLYQPPHLILHLLFILEAGKEDPDIIDVIFQVGCFRIENEHDLSLRPEVKLLALPFHIAFPLLLCRGCIPFLVPEDTHTSPSRLNDCVPGDVKPD